MYFGCCRYVSLDISESGNRCIYVFIMVSFSYIWVELLKSTRFFDFPSTEPDFLTWEEEHVCHITNMQYASNLVTLKLINIERKQVEGPILLLTVLYLDMTTLSGNITLFWNSWLHKTHCRHGWFYDHKHGFLQFFHPSL